MIQTNYQVVNNEMLKLALIGKTNDILNAVVDATQNVVQAGPFAGMLLPEDTSWSGSDRVPKLVGTYEQELHPVIEAAIQRKPDVVFNIGAAEGYYAIGLARRLKGIPVAAFDTDPKALDICKTAAQFNGLVDRVTYQAEFHSWMFAHYCYDAKPLFVIDCEGAEKDLIDDLAVKSLGNADLIIECHDFKDPSITPLLCQRLKETHRIDLIYEGPRDATTIPALRQMGSFERAVALCEWRPTLMHWLACWSKTRSEDVNATQA